MSPLRRGAECVRLALEKKTSSPVRLEKDSKGKTETRRKLFSSEEDSGTTDEGNGDGKEIFTDDDMLPPPVKPSVAPLKRRTPDVTRNSKQAPNLKPFTSLEYDSPTKAKK